MESQAQTAQRFPLASPQPVAAEHAYASAVLNQSATHSQHNRKKSLRDRGDEKRRAL